MLPTRNIVGSYFLLNNIQNMVENAKKSQYYCFNKPIYGIIYTTSVQLVSVS